MGIFEIFCKGSLKLEGSKENADIAADDFKKWVYGKWFIAPERKMKEYGHPAMFPEELAKHVIQLFSFRESVVLDPFAGAGTACVVANDWDSPISAWMFPSGIAIPPRKDWTRKTAGFYHLNPKVTREGVIRFYDAVMKGMAFGIYPKF